MTLEGAGGAGNKLANAAKVAALGFGSTAIIAAIGLLLG